MSTNTETTGSCCSSSSTNPAAAPEGHTNLLDATGDDLTTCPVMVGSQVSKTTAVAAGLYRDYEGTRYYFCCGGCGPAFDSDPAKYAANMA